MDDEVLKRRKARRAEEDEKERVRTDKRTTDLEEGVPEVAEGSTEKLDEIMRRVEVMIEQVNSLYLSFVRGIDTQSPLIRRGQLETIMANLTNMPKPTAIYRFRFHSILSSFNQHRDRWDKLMKDLEDGKIKRAPRAKPLRRTG